MRPPDWRETRISELVSAIRQLAEGRSNAAGQVTLTQNAATTTVTNDVIPAGCYPQLTPASANASAELAVYVSSVAKGSFIISHPSNATASRIWNWFAVGG